MPYYKNKNIIWSTIKKLSNLNASIILLLLIASISILGTIIEQDQTLDYYQSHYPIDNSKIGITWKIIILLGLNNIYINWWFISLLFLFFCTLIACTFSRQLPGLKNARNWKFTPYKQINQHQKILPTGDIQTLSNIIYELNIKNYYIFHKENYIYAYKGIIGRVAPILVHISIIMTLTGSILGLISGFTAQQMIPNSETFHIQNIIKSGWMSSLPQNIVGKVDRFTIDYNKDTSIKQFYSSLYLLNNKGKYLTKKVISVNYPLVFNKLTFYQTDWKIHALRLKIGNQYHIQQKLQKINIGHTDVWIYKLPINITKHISLIVTSLEDKILLYNESGQFINSIAMNDNFYINDTNITVEEIMTQTGIQIKTDLGIQYVYISFLTLIISITMSYLSYSQIWIYNKDKNLELKGTTNRSKLTFEEELTYIQKKILKY